MKLRSFGFAFLAMILSGAAMAQLPRDTEVPPGALDEADALFIQDANTSNITQIVLGRKAAANATNPGIHSLADRIVSSHVKADQALQMLASRKHVDVPRRPTAEDQGEIDAVSNHRRGGEFDADYMRTIINDHDRMIAMYQEARAQSEDPDIRYYADVMLPALRENREQAIALQNRQLGSNAPTP